MLARIVYVAAIGVSVGGLVLAQESPRQPELDGAQTFCTLQYDPVCARLDEDRRTFGNSCEAERAGYAIVHPGECDDENGGSGEAQLCTREYRPVCAARGDQRRTFGNSCEAEKAGYRIIYDGAC